nr:hyp [Cotesia vestalis bracovirus]
MERLSRRKSFCACCGKGPRTVLKVEFVGVQDNSLFKVLIVRLTLKTIRDSHYICSG